MATNPIVKVPPEGQLGPAMRDLPNDNWRAFVVAMLELGDNNYVRAARAAGFDGTEGSVKVRAHRLAHDERVQLAIHEESLRRLNSGKIMAVSTIITLTRSAAKDSDKLKAAEMILNRTGLHGQSEHKVTVQDISKTDAAMVERIEQLCAQMNIDPQKMLGDYRKPPVVDAEFTEVKPDDEHSTEGLEDVL